jgi:hypothetical protein
MAGETFDTAAWIRDCPHDVQMPPVSQPVQLAGWTKTVRGGGADRHSHGDHAGAPNIRLFLSVFFHQTLRLYFRA